MRLNVKFDKFTKNRETWTKMFMWDVASNVVWSVIQFIWHALLGSI